MQRSRALRDEAPQKDGFLRRERRFDVVSYIELAPYFKLPPNTLLESFRIVFLVMWFLCLTRCQN